MAKRKDAAMRLLLGIVGIVLVYVVGVVISLFLFAWAAVDISWQLLTGDDGLSAGGYGTRVFDWMTGNSEYVYFGKGEWMWLP